MEFKLTGINLNEMTKDRPYIETVIRNIEKIWEKIKEI